jgi:hypothetical protein
MAPPSQVPSAVALAQGCATAYEQQSGEVLHPDCHRSIELLADHFAQRGQLEGIFLGIVIRAAGLAPFVRGPNLGHEALGDFLACGAIELNISTNVDVLTEMAAESIGEPLSGVAVTRAEAVTGAQEEAVCTTHPIAHDGGSASISFRVADSRRSGDIQDET